MLAQKCKGGFHFTSLTFDGAFIVKLTLANNGEETLETCPVGTMVRFKARPLSRGTIQKTIGPERWSNFLSMKEHKLHKMFLDQDQDRSSMGK